ncbi:hypothetical protein [Candidatus Nanohalovita haloferacivicina]|uniref:hypothetical protein n=1 Tax=Candidatus Nanohalovita haloferacivicina TaxID=2978046 RepID=UPI00325F9FB6|nr:hypothetical protein HBNXNv_0511 [Candidatus Nanohalobia archaeon BNXNv]
MEKFWKAVAALTVVNIAGVVLAVLVAQIDLGFAVILLLVSLIGGPAIIIDRFFMQ